MLKLALNLAPCFFLLAAGCGSNNSATIDADPNAPDADPNAPDADPNAPDALPAPDASAACSPVGGTPNLTLQTVANGLQRPVLLVSPPGDPRQFVVEQPGRIRIIENGNLVVTPFLNITAAVNDAGNEQGLLGLAFHPNYVQNGRFFVNYTATGGGAAGQTIVAEYTVSNNPNVANMGENPILAIPQPYTNHNGGMIAFGPDGFLYVGMGDGGSGGDPQDRGQNLNESLGKMLRIDADTGSAALGNPFIGVPNTVDKIWAYGLRNPWRFSFDRLTGDLYIGDVGQGQWEEIDVQAANSTGGENYGWNMYEGQSCFNGPCSPTGMTMPVHVYSHGGGNCSVTGGYVYRGCAMPGHHGKYFFADFCVSAVKTFEWNGNSATNFLDWANLSGGGISSFGEDADGELYIMRLGAGTVHKIVPL